MKDEDQAKDQNTLIETDVLMTTTIADPTQGDAQDQEMMTIDTMKIDQEDKKEMRDRLMI